VSRPYATDEQYERWFVAECCRCGRRKNKAGSWPDGYVCRTCADRAVRTRGICPGCGQERALPGRRPGDGAAICTDCAGFSQSFACARCGLEGKLHGGRLCTRCALAARLAELLDDGSGQIRPALVPLADALLAMDNPLSGLTWLYSRKGRAGSPGDLLWRLGRGEIALTHEAFHALQPWRAAAHLRELLMACGVLPAVDKQVCSLERWLPGHLASITDDGHAQLIRRFATWDVLPRLRARAEKKPVTPAARRHAGDQVKRATAFLQWLSGRGLTLADCRQADIDAWYAGNNEHARNYTRPFLQWCMRNKLTRRFQLPQAVTRHAAPLSGGERVSQLGRVLTAHDLPLRARVAAALVLLYAQPLSRIVRLTLDDVIRDGDQVLLRLGEPPSPVPAPVADLLLSWIGNRDNMNTATNRNSPWLFPGRRAGQPMNPDTLALLVNDIGIPTTPGRTSAIRQHVLEMPAPVVADALGYHPVTTARLAGQAAGTFGRYAPGDHLRPPSGRKPEGDP
jgi:integrase